MDKYPCMLIIRIAATDGIAIGTRDIELPFPPTSDLVLVGAFVDPGEAGGGDESGPLSVSYDVEDDRFMIREWDDNAYEAGFTMAQAMATYHPDFEWTTESYAVGNHPHSGIN